MLQVQSQFETVVKRFNKEQKEVEDLLQIRDQAYLDLLASNDGQAVVEKQQISLQKGQNYMQTLQHHFHSDDTHY